MSASDVLIRMCVVEDGSIWTLFCVFSLIAIIRTLGALCLKPFALIVLLRCLVTFMCYSQYNWDGVVWRMMHHG